MYNIKGDLDLYVHDKDGNLIRHHTQSNYDTIRARLNPSFSSTVDRITRFECVKKYFYPRPVHYDEFVEIPLYLDEPIFSPSTITPDLTSDGFFTLSYDKGNTWVIHDGTDFIPVTADNAADLRLHGMDKQALINISASAHLSKYIDHVVIRATPDLPNNTISSYVILMRYDHTLLDPYYARWIGDMTTIDRYNMDTIPISTSMSGNIYVINISNLSGVAPINVDTIMTKVGDYIGTFTYVGITVEIDQVLTGTYTISVNTDTDIYATRTNNAEYIMWGTSSPSYNDGISGGVRYQGAESRLSIYTYNGGPAENKWMYPFMPDRSFRQDALSRSIVSEFSSDREWGENYIDSEYAIQSTGGVKLWTVSPDLYSGLGIVPLLYRYVFLNTGDAGVAEYLLFYKSRVSNLLHDFRWRPVRIIYNDDGNDPNIDQNSRWMANYNMILKDPLNPAIWNWIMYEDLAYDGEHIPRCAYNPFHDLIVEIYDDHLLIRQYGNEPIFRLEANVNETFELATMTYEDPCGHDLILYSYDADAGLHYLSSIPLIITRDYNKRGFNLTITGDLTERYFLGNIHNPVSQGSTGSNLQALLKVQDVKNGPWTTSRLLTELKEINDESYLFACHNDIGGTMDDVNVVYDQQWNYRHLNKYGNIVTSNDAWGETVTEFDGTSLIYLDDDRGTSGRSTRIDMVQQNVCTYLEYQPDLNQNSTLMYLRDGKYKLKDDGTLEVGTINTIPINISMRRKTQYAITLNYVDYKYHSAYIDPISDTPNLVIFSTRNDSNNGPRIARLDVSSISSPIAEWKSISPSGEVYWDNATSELKIPRISNNSNGIFLSILNITTQQYDVLEQEILVDGSSFTHASDSLLSMYSNNLDEAILVIFSGNGWIQADGIIEINLNTLTANKIITTGTFYPYINFYEYSDNWHKAVTFRNNAGDTITAAMRNQVIGQFYIHNHNTGVVEYIEIGELLSTAEFTDYFRTSNMDYWYRRPSSLSRIGDGKFALFGGCNYDSFYGFRWYQTLIDLDNMAICSKSIPTLEPDDRPYSSGSNYFNNIGPTACNYPFGHEKENIIYDDTWCGVNFTRYSTTSYQGIRPAKTILDTRDLLLAQNSTPITYNSSIANKLAILEYPNFTLSIGDTSSVVTGPNRYFNAYNRNFSTKRLSTFNLGGEFNYVSGDNALPASYTADNLYTGKIKNISIKTQFPYHGAYKFLPYLYKIGDVDSFITNFTNTTTFLLVIKEGFEQSTYFLDSNNSLVLTEITDTNLNSVTPNTILEINNNLTAIIGLVGTDSHIGLLYYNINGDLVDTDISLTYAKYKCEKGAPGYDRAYHRHRAGQKLLAKNGKCFIVYTPSGGIYDHSDAIIHMHGLANRVWYPMLNGTYSTEYLSFIYTFQDSNLYDSAPTPIYSGCSFFMLDKYDNISIQMLDYQAQSNINNNQDYPPRHYILDDAFSDDNYDIGIWVRQEADLAENEIMVFYRPNRPKMKFYQIPAVSYDFEGSSSESTTCMHPLAIENGKMNTAYPYPYDAPDKFKSITNSTGYKSWYDLRWYFIDGPGSSFVQNEMINFSVINHFGYSIDNWQVINTFNSLIKGGQTVSNVFGIQDSSSVDATSIGFNKRVGIVDKSSMLIDPPLVQDKFFLLFDKDNILDEV